MLLGLALGSACRANAPHPPVTEVPEPSSASASSEIIELEEDPTPAIRFAADDEESSDAVVLTCGPRDVDVTVAASSDDGRTLEVDSDDLWLSLQGSVLDAFDRLESDLRLQGGTVHIELPVRKGQLAPDRAAMKGPPHLVELVRPSLDAVSATPFEPAEAATVIIDVEFFDHTMACDSITPYGVIKTAARPTDSPSS